MYGSLNVKLSNLSERGFP